MADYVYADGILALPDPPSLQAMVVQATQERLDDFARTRNYDGILSACTYATQQIRILTQQLDKSNLTLSQRRAISQLEPRF